MTREQYFDFVAIFFKKIVTNSLMGFITSKASILLWGPFGVLTSMLIEAVANWLANESALRIYFMHTDFRISKQGDLFLKDVEEYYQIKTKGSEDEIFNAEVKVMESFKNLIHFA